MVTYALELATRSQLCVTVNIENAVIIGIHLNSLYSSYITYIFCHMTLALDISYFPLYLYELKCCSIFNGHGIL